MAGLIVDNKHEDPPLVFPSYFEVNNPTLLVRLLLCISDDPNHVKHRFYRHRLQSFWIFKIFG